METIMTRLEKLKSLCAAATPGPWEFGKDKRISGSNGATVCDVRYKNGYLDGPLLAASCEIPALLALVESMAGALDAFAEKDPDYGSNRADEALTAFAAWNVQEDV